MIVVDNGSIDNSATIIDEELEKMQDVHVQFVREERKSNPIAGWNRPLSFAQGLYIAICEGDDYYEPDHLFQAKKILEQLPIAGLYVSDLKLNEDVPRVIVSSPQRKLSELKILVGVLLLAVLFLEENPWKEFDLILMKLLFGQENTLYYKI